MADDQRLAKVVYWSGTGNSHRVARWMEAFLGQPVECLPMGNDRDIEYSHDSNKLLILVYPTHGFTSAYHVLKYVGRLPRGNGCQSYCMATRAGIKAGPLYLPGLSGSAMFLVAILLLMKGYSVLGCRGIDMPSNWFTLHPPQSEKSVRSIINRAEEKVAAFARIVNNRKKNWLTFNNLYEASFGLLLLPLSLAYLLMGRFVLAKLFFSNSRCNGCGLCAQHCSVGALIMVGRKSPRPFWRYSCESCMRCAAICPHNAVEAGHSWAVIVYLITTGSFFSWLLTTFSMGLFNVAEDIPVWLFYILWTLYVYPGVFLAYRLFHWLLRLPFINMFFSWTTLTHLPFWRRYKEPDVKLRDI